MLIADRVTQFHSHTFKLFYQLYNLYIVHQSDSLIAGEKKKILQQSRKITGQSNLKFTCEVSHISTVKVIKLHYGKIHPAENTIESCYAATLRFIRLIFSGL